MTWLRRSSQKKLTFADDHGEQLVEVSVELEIMYLVADIVILS